MVINHVPTLLPIHARLVPPLMLLTYHMVSLVPLYQPSPTSYPHPAPPPTNLVAIGVATKGRCLASNGPSISILI